MRKAGLIAGVLLFLGALGWWVWFLSTKSLADADSWSSVASGIVGLVGLALAVWGGRGSSSEDEINARDIGRNALLTQKRESRTARKEPSKSRRTINVRDVGEGATIDQSDDSRP